jgi:translation elongation factor EF-Ts
MIKEEGKYSHLWMKYAAVIHVLLKKTENENQRLQLYKHEFENIGHRSKTPVSFSLNLINGRAQNIVSSTEIARDLWRVLDNNQATKNWLKERSVKISIEKNYELHFEKI